MSNEGICAVIGPKTDILTEVSSDVFSETGSALSKVRSQVFRIAVVIAGLVTVVACSPNSDVSSEEEVRATVTRTNDAVVARVEDTLIYESDVQRAAAAKGLIGPNTVLSSDDPVFAITVEELIDQRLLALDAVRTGVSGQEEAKRRLAEARDRILGNIRVETYLADAVNDTTIRELYEAQKGIAGKGEERRIREIVLADEATANLVIGRLKDEESFAVLAEEFSTDGASRDQGGELGWINREMLPAPLRGPVFTTVVGGRTNPVQTEAGWHIVEVLDRRVPNQRSFEDTRDDIARFMTFDAIDSLMTDLRDRAEIERPYQRTDLDSEEIDPDSDIDDVP